jgi:tetratricopeptide (TPR) repeat protein/energy-coupling factor transporter ATP-binding protein EcfA2
MTASNQTSPLPEWPARLRDMLVEYFNLDNLASLCLDLGIDFEELGEGAKSRRVVRLIKLVGDKGRLPDLIDRCAELRPGLDWQSLRDKAVENPDVFKLIVSTDDNILSLLHQIADQTLVTNSEAQDIEAEAPEPGEPPYLGLQYFTEEDADHFFGREMLTAQVIGRLHDAHFLAVIGASGSGKSSLVRAGIMPALRLGQTLADGSQTPANSSQWTIHVMTPSAHPLDALAATLTQESDSITAVIELQTALSQNNRALTLAAQQRLARQNSPHLLLVIDQFEEIFTLCRQPVERKSFIDNLVTAVNPEDNNPITILITLRADFYAQCAQDDNLRRLVSQHQEYIGAMNREELARAIVQPAAMDNWRIQEGLVEQMLDDVGDEPGALPLLSHALLETWKRRRGRTMTLSGYRESGGVRGAIAQTAETIFQQRLTPEQQPIARMIFVRLTELGESVDGDTPDTRRRAAFSELITRTTDPDMLNAVLDILTQSRLITTDLLPPDDTKVVEVSHEALIREWPTLRNWLNQDRENLIHQRQLTDDVNEWLKLNRDPGALYRGVRLQQMQAWASSFPEPLSTEEQEFLDASQAEAARAARSQRIQKILLGVLAFIILGLFALIILVFANPERTADQLGLTGTATPCIPQIMPGKFNVAVAEFAVLDENGILDMDNDAGQMLAKRVQNNLVTAFDEDSGITVWADGADLQAEFCTELGVVADDLANAAAPTDLAERVKSDVVVYGTLQPVANRAELQLKFYLAPQLGLDFGNIVGTYAFESSIPVFDISDPGSEVDLLLAKQAEALARTARGFTYEILGRPEEALADFEQAAAAVPESDFVHFFVGQENLFLAQDSDTSNPDAYLAAAEAAFEQASENARAQIGLSGVHFIRAQTMLNAFYEGNGAEQELKQASAEAKEAYTLAEMAASEGSQVEVYGVPVDLLSQYQMGISLRLLAETAYNLGDVDQAGIYLQDAVSVLQTAVSSLSENQDPRLEAQLYQALGTVYEWQAFLYGEQGLFASQEDAMQDARNFYLSCVDVGLAFPFDTFLAEEIVEKLCTPRLGEAASGP